jgi:glycosyltransferase involved in cell wall biosynthesis
MRQPDRMVPPMTGQPLVSIVIPVYNGGNFLREAIDSALAQTWPNIEVLVVNDGSFDGGETERIARSYGDRIRYIAKENGGVATALNRGIQEMRGEYFSWLSHDDVYYPEKIARQMAQLLSMNDDKAVLFCNCHVTDHTSHITGSGTVDESLLGNSILLIIGTYVGGCSLLIPKVAFKTAGLFNESLRNSQDNEMWLRLAMAGYRFHYMPEILIQSREHAEQGSQTTSTRHAEEIRAFYDWALGFIGRENRIKNATGLFRILLMKRLPSLAVQFFRMLSADRSFFFAFFSIIKGASSMVQPSFMSKLASVPGIGLLMDLIKKNRFRNSSHYWEKRYQQGGTSGAGSYGRFAEYKAEVLNGFVAGKGIDRVAEFGCGDGNQLKYFNFARYLGIDVSPAAVDLCRKTYMNDPARQFLVYSGSGSVEQIRQFAPDMTISLDVIYHLVEDAVFEEYMTNLFSLSSRYVIIYSTNFDMKYGPLHQIDRKFTDFIEKNIKGWRLSEIVINPHKGTDSQSDFYIYEKIADTPVNH